MMKVVSEADHENLGWAFAGGERFAGIWSIISGAFSIVAQLMQRKRPLRKIDLQYLDFGGQTKLQWYEFRLSKRRNWAQDREE